MKEFVIFFKAIQSQCSRNIYCVILSAYISQREVRNEHTEKTRHPNVVFLDVWNFCFSSSLPMSTRAHHPSERLCGTRQFAWKRLCTDTVHEECDISSMCCRQQLADEARSKFWRIIERSSQWYLARLSTAPLCDLKFSLQPGKIDHEPMYD